MLPPKNLQPVKEGDVIVSTVMQFVREVGFPIAIAIYLLVVVDGHVQNLTRAVSELTIEIRAMRGAR
jgi:hypothetical protein